MLGLQWNSDYDSFDQGLPRSTIGQNRVKFGINVEQKETLRAIFSGDRERLAQELQSAFVELPDSVHCRIYKHTSRRSKEPVFEHCARQMRQGEVTEAVNLIADLLSGQRLGYLRGYPKPHFHLYKEIWHEGESLDH